MKYNKLLWKMKVNQLLIRLGLREPDPIWYIGGSDVLPQPLPRAKEREVLEAMKNGDLGGQKHPHRAQPSPGGLHCPPL